MPKPGTLTRNEVTASSRMMLPFYPLFAMGVGLAYALGDPARTNTATFYYVREIMPLSSWGWVFIAFSIVQTIMLVMHSRVGMVVALSVAFGAYIMWALSYIASILQTETASLSAPWLWIMVAVAHLASVQSITKDK